MGDLQLTVRTEGQSVTVDLNDDDLADRSVSQVVADVVAPVVGASKPIHAKALRELSANPKASFCVKQEDADGNVRERFVTRSQPLKDVISERTRQVALEMERAADGGP